jgi:hypothetical protein
MKFQFESELFAILTLFYIWRNSVDSSSSFPELIKIWYSTWHACQNGNNIRSSQLQMHVFWFDYCCHLECEIWYKFFSGQDKIAAVKFEDHFERSRETHLAVFGMPSCLKSLGMPNGWYMAYTLAYYQKALFGIQCILYIVNFQKSKSIHICMYIY